MRSKKGLTVARVISETGLDISAGLYSQWENNKKIPQPRELNILCEFLGINKKTAFFLWAQSQMPSDSLKKLFQVKGSLETDMPSMFSLVGAPAVYPASKTITIQERDVPFFLKHPEAGGLLVNCLAVTIENKAASKPEALLAKTTLPKQAGIKLLNELVNLNYLQKADGKYRTAEGIEYIYLPETEAFEPLRKARIEFNVGRLLKSMTFEDFKSDRSFRETLTTHLSPQELSQVISSLKKLSGDFFSKSEEPASTRRDYYNLILLLGPVNG